MIIFIVSFSFNVDFIIKHFSFYFRLTWFRPCNTQTFKFINFIAYISDSKKFLERKSFNYLSVVYLGSIIIMKYIYSSTYNVIYVSLLAWCPIACFSVLSLDISPGGHTGQRAAKWPGSGARPRHGLEVHGRSTGLWPPPLLAIDCRPTKYLRRDYT